MRCCIHNVHLSTFKVYNAAGRSIINTVILNRLICVALRTGSVRTLPGQVNNSIVILLEIYSKYPLVARSFSALTPTVGWQEGHPNCKNKSRTGNLQSSLEDPWRLGQTRRNRRKIDLPKAVCSTYIHTYIYFISDKVHSTLYKIDRQTDNRNKMHKAKHQLHTHYANRLHVFNNIVSAIDPLLTKPKLTIMYKSTKN